MTKIELAWVAGLFDGEGCVSIVRIPAKAQVRCTTDRYTLVVKIAMCDHASVQRVSDLLGIGTVQRGMFKSKRWNASYVWMCQSLLALAVLRRLRPYLVTKALEADVAIEFMSLPLAARGGHGGSKTTDQKLVDKRRGLYWLLRSLKSRWRFYRIKARMTRRDRELLREAIRSMKKR